jgi:hypothetical protein
MGSAAPPAASNLTRLLPVAFKRAALSASGVGLATRKAYELHIKAWLYTPSASPAVNNLACSCSADHARHAPLPIDDVAVVLQILV